MIPVSNQNLPKHFVGADRGQSRKMVRRKPGIAPRRQFGPDQHSDFICHIEIHGVGDLQVAAQHVDSKVFRLDHHVANEFHGGRRVDGFRVEVLVQCGAHEKRFAVEIKMASLRFKRAKGKTGAAAVLDCTT